MEGDKVIMVCGYKKTGKDTFCKKLEGDFDFLTEWEIYKHPSTTKTFVHHKKYEIVAFADKLKKEASLIYNIPLEIPDNEKDMKRYKHPMKQDIISARDIYIEWGTKRREQTPEYWCRKAFRKISKGEKEKTIIISDWRFYNEFLYAVAIGKDITTIRLYRSDVKVPDLNIDSEHNLDKYTTDFILVAKGEFDKAFQQFPQYNNYIKV